MSAASARTLLSFVVLGIAALTSACAAAPTDAPPAVSTCAAPFSLAVGEVRVFQGGASLACLVASSASIATDYLFVAANANPVADDLRSYLVRATLKPSAALDMSVRSNRVAASGAREFDRDAFGDRLEGAVRQASRQALGGRALLSLGSAGRGADDRSAPAHAVVAPAVGDSMLLRVGNAASASLCNSFANVRGVVKALGRRSTIVLDAAAPSGGFTDSDFRELAAEFDAITYPTDSAWFGVPTDINGDGRITILFTPQINRLTPTGSLGFASGFFYMHDLLPRDVTAQNYHCPASNEQEILYLLVPDPNGQVNSNRFSVETARESARGTMAHELQHMINQGVRQTRGVGTLEVDWLNEGLSHFAEEVAGRATLGFTDLQRLSWNLIFADLDAFDSFFRQNLIRLRYWMDRPDLASPVSSLAATELAPRGAAWAFVRFAVDQFGASNPRAFTRALVAGPQVDVANLAARTGVPFEQMLPRFLLASYGDVPTASLVATHRFASWNLRNVMESLNGGAYPLRVQSFPSEAATQSRSGSGNFFLASRAAGADPATFRMLGVDGQPVSFAGAQISVARLR